MKKVLFLSLVIIIASFFTSCESRQQPVTTKTTTVTTKTTVTEPGADGFLISKEIVVKGNTVWGFSQKVYGTGFQWRDIVAQNPFLQQPGRVYYDEARKMWIVKIYPGEVVKVGGEIVSPSYTVEETVTTVETTGQEAEIKSSSVDFNSLLWGILAGLALIAFFVWLFGYYRPADRNNSNNSSANSNVRVDIRSNDIDADLLLQERVRMIQRRQYLQEDMWDDSYSILKKSAKNNRLKSFTTVQTEQGEILINANFRRDRRAEKSEKRNEQKEDKK